MYENPRMNMILERIANALEGRTSTPIGDFKQLMADLNDQIAQLKTLLVNDDSALQAALKIIQATATAAQTLAADTNTLATKVQNGDLTEVTTLASKVASDAKNLSDAATGVSTTVTTLDTDVKNVLNAPGAPASSDSSSAG